MKAQRKPSMSKEQAVELYNDLQRAMNKMIRNTAGMRSAKDKIAAIEKRPQEVPLPTEEELTALTKNLKKQDGHKGILLVISALVVARVVLGVIEYLIGSSSTRPAYAHLQTTPRVAEDVTLDKKEIALLKQLDIRRAELERRRERLDAKELELDNRDEEYAVKITELRELTQQLESARQKNLRKKVEQIEQLAKVYTSMNPPEAAALIQQLDPQIAIALLERMPDKRMAQILSLMTADKALMFTKMLTGRYGI
jgi:flagellar motility protein MotE (MotC chaperone)